MVSTTLEADHATFSKGPTDETPSSRSQGGEGCTYADKVKMIGVNELVPNPWNPNRMNDQEFQELVAEVRHVGAIAKPIIVRPAGAKHEIIDGEHNWLASKEAGLWEVPVVVDDLDDFEAMRQTMKRNQHGRHDPLLEGEMFARMKEGRKLSIRQLAKEINLPESTIRNRLKYIEALGLRKACAPDMRTAYADDDRQVIASLSLDQVASYTALPAGVRDRWLDAGASLKTLTEIISVDEDNHEIWTGENLLCLIADSGLADLLKADKGFLQSLKALGKLALRNIDHVLDANARACLRPVAELGLPAKAIDLLPYRMSGGVASVMLTPSQWTDILRQSAAQTKDPIFQLKLIGDGVREVLQQSGMDPAETLTQRQIEHLAELQEAPDFIRDTEFLSIEEQYRLFRALVVDQDGLAEQAAQMTVEEFQHRREGKGEDEGDEVPYREGRDVASVFRECLDELKRRQRLESEDEVFDNRDCLKQRILAKLRDDEAIRYGIVGNGKALPLLLEDLDQWDDRTLALLGATLLYRHSTVSPTARWLMAAGGVVSKDVDRVGAKT